MKNGRLAGGHFLVVLMAVIWSNDDFWCGDMIEINEGHMVNAVENDLHNSRRGRSTELPVSLFPGLRGCSWALRVACIEYFLVKA